jgi:hypothetical protein
MKAGVWGRGTVTRRGKLAKLLVAEMVLVLGRDGELMASGLPVGVWRACKGVESNAMGDIDMLQ